MAGPTLIFRLCCSASARDYDGKLRQSSLLPTDDSHIELTAIEALGNPGWNWSEFLKYFKKVWSRVDLMSPCMCSAVFQAETTLPPDPDVAAKHHLHDIDPQFHGSSGPLVKSYSAHYSIGTLHDPLLETFRNLDVPINYDAVRDVTSRLLRLGIGREANSIYRTMAIS